MSPRLICASPLPGAEGTATWSSIAGIPLASANSPPRTTCFFPRLGDWAVMKVAPESNELPSASNERSEETVARRLLRRGLEHVDGPAEKHLRMQHSEPRSRDTMNVLKHSVSMIPHPVPHLLDCTGVQSFLFCFVGLTLRAAFPCGFGVAGRVLPERKITPRGTHYAGRIRKPEGAPFGG
jgi:hypothetical protein